MADMLSQEEINALLGGMDTDSGSDNSDTQIDLSNSDDDLSNKLTSEQKDILGEVGNIAMGTSATTLFALLGQKVLITTPTVSIVRWAEVAKHYDRPCVGVRVNYTEGISGTNVLLLKHHDVKIITSLMMGWGGVVEGDDEMTEMDLSAISEAMNQMIGSSSTSMAALIKRPIDIDTPVAFVIDFESHKLLENLGFEEEFAACVQFRMEIGDLIDSNIMQLLPIRFAEEMIEVMKSHILGGGEEEAPAPAPSPAPQAAAPQMFAPENVPPMQPAQGYAPPPQQQQQQQPPPQYAPPPHDPYAQQYAPPQGYAPPPPGYGYPPPQQYAPQGYVPPQPNVQSAQFHNFDINEVYQQKENIEIIMDVPLEVTVELGRTTKKIKEILEFQPGSIIELNKLSGEPIDILVNGKFVAKGEVVVIDENFGIRVTNIISAEHRI
jgi:flagellar motor switch protein FliN/FliY